MTSTMRSSPEGELMRPWDLRFSASKTEPNGPFHTFPCIEYYSSRKQTNSRWLRYFLIVHYSSTPLRLGDYYWRRFTTLESTPGRHSEWFSGSSYYGCLEYITRIPLPVAIPDYWGIWIIFPEKEIVSLVWFRSMPYNSQRTSKWCL
jgi:hypothetical protein